jgi:hypothetical protein
VWPIKILAAHNLNQVQRVQQFSPVDNTRLAHTTISESELHTILIAARRHPNGLFVLPKEHRSRRPFVVFVVRPEIRDFVGPRTSLRRWEQRCRQQRRHLIADLDANESGSRKAWIYVNIDLAEFGFWRYPLPNRDRFL